MKEQLLIIKINFLLFSGGLTAQNKYLEPNLAYGPYQVGFKVFHEYDYSRTIERVHLSDKVPNRQEIARPMQISIWYPADIKGPKNQMSYRNYLHLMATQLDFNYDEAPLSHPFVQKRLYEDPFIDQDQLELALQTTTVAYEDAPAKKGTFPVMVYGPGGYGTSCENATLWEYLASHGFIVASYPALGMKHAPKPKGQGRNFGVWTFETAARDMEFTIGFMHDFPNVDMNRLGIAGFSLGGSTVTKVLSRNIQVKAGASLDGWHPEKVIKDWMPSVDFDRIQVPFLHLHQSHPRKNPNEVVYDSLSQQDAYNITFNKFGHVFYGSFWVLLSDHDADDRNAIRGTQEEINLGFNLLADYVLHFFDGYLNDKGEGKKQLQQLHQRSEIPKNFMDFEMKKKTLK